MSSGQVVKRAKYKTTVKDPGTPGVLRLVHYQPIPFTFSFFFFIFSFFFSMAHEICVSTTLQTQEKFVFRPNDPTSNNKLEVDFRIIKSTYHLLFMLLLITDYEA